MDFRVNIIKPETYKVDLIKPKILNLSQSNNITAKLDYENSNIESMEIVDLLNANYYGGYDLANDSEYEKAQKVFQYWSNIIIGEN